jgi:single-stranded DNA-binding protein
LNNYKPGEQVKVSINLRGREWVSPQGETKYFNSIQGWRVERVQADAPMQGAAPAPATQTFEPASNFTEEDHDDLPF